MILFICFWLCWVFAYVSALQLRYLGFSWWELFLFQSIGSGHLGFSSCDLWALEHGLRSRGHGVSCSAACGIIPNQGSNPCSLQWRADSLPLSHQGSPENFIFKKQFHLFIIFGCADKYKVISHCGFDLHFW